MASESQKLEKIAYSNGTIEYRLNSKLHREDGPAVIWPDGFVEWYLNGKRHREDGPSIMYPNDLKAWYVNDKYYNTEEDYIVYLLEYYPKEISFKNLLNLKGL